MSTDVNARTIGWLFLVISGLAVVATQWYDERVSTQAVKNKLRTWREKSPTTFAAYWDARKREEAGI